MKLLVEIVRAALRMAVRANSARAAALAGKRVGIEVPNGRLVVEFEAGEDGRPVAGVVSDSVAECDATLRISVAGLLFRLRALAGEPGVASQGGFAGGNDAASMQGNADVMADFLALLRPRLPLPEGLPSPDLRVIGEDIGDALRLGARAAQSLLEAVSGSTPGGSREGEPAAGESTRGLPSQEEFAELRRRVEELERRVGAPAAEADDA